MPYTFDLETDLSSSETVLVAIIVVIISSFILGFWWRNTFKKGSSKKKDVVVTTYPPYAPASTLETVRQMASIESPWFMLRCAKDAGSFVFQFRLPLFTSKTPMVVAVGDATVAREILLDTESFKPDWIYRKGRLGPTMFNSEGYRWKLARKGVAPAFSSRHVRRMNTICMQMTEEWIRNVLEPSIDRDESFDLPAELTRLTIQIICEAAFEYKASVEEMDQFTQNVEIALRGSQALNPVTRALGRLLPSFRRIIAAADGMADFSQTILTAYRQRQEEKKKNKKNAADDNEDDTVVSLIANNPHYKNDKERLADLTIFLIAGHDTTSYSLAWTLLELARNPKEMSKLKQALANTPSRDEWVRSEPLKNALKESMRLHPVAAMGSIRVPIKDITYQDSGVKTTIPKGSTVFIPQILLNRNPDTYTEPDQFVPSRWDNANANMEAAHMPFALGRRNCVGQSLASAELHSVLARLVADYDFTVEEEGSVEYFVTLKPLGARLKAHRTKK